MTKSFPFLLLFVLVVTTGCDSLFGSKSDDVTDEILEEGRIDPTLLDDVGYVPLQPFFTQAADGGTFDAPRDVQVGFDQFIYVVDADGLHVLDLAGRPQAFLAIDEATSVMQDRRFHVYVTSRRDTTLTVDGGDRTYNLPVVYRYSGLTTGQPVLEDIIWHPFDDSDREIVLSSPVSSDEEVQFTGVAILPDNRIYVTRTGPELRGSPSPNNTVMLFTADGRHLQNTSGLTSYRPSLASTYFPTDIITTVQPPQRTSFAASNDFFIAQSPYPSLEAPDTGGQALSNGVLSIVEEVTPDGVRFTSNTELANVAFAADPDDGDGFLYEEFKFELPADLAYAADGTNYLFVIDAGKDSLFVFNANGIEGVRPPAGASGTKPVVVSFGGTGDGPLQFRNPRGVSYFDRTVYVADTGNNRIARFRLNTDFE